MAITLGVHTCAFVHQPSTILISTLQDRQPYTTTAAEIRRPQLYPLYSEHHPAPTQLLACCSWQHTAGNTVNVMRALQHGLATGISRLPPRISAPTIPSNTRILPKCIAGCKCSQAVVCSTSQGPTRPTFGNHAAAHWLLALLCWPHTPCLYCWASCMCLQLCLRFQHSMCVLQCSGCRIITLMCNSKHPGSTDCIDGTYSPWLPISAHRCRKHGSCCCCCDCFCCSRYCRCLCHAVRSCHSCLCSCVCRLPLLGCQRDCLLGSLCCGVGSQVLQHHGQRWCDKRGLARLGILEKYLWRKQRQVRA
jgi:hypothetical protein